MTETPDYGPAAQVRLTQANIAVLCTITAEDGREHSCGVKSLDMRGARREITEALAKLGYDGAGRWQAQEDGSALRKFRRVTSR